MIFVQIKGSPGHPARLTSLHLAGIAADALTGTRGIPAFHAGLLTSSTDGIKSSELEARGLRLCCLAVCSPAIG